MNSSESQDGNGNVNFGGINRSRVTRLPVVMLTPTVCALPYVCPIGRFFVGRVVRERSKRDDDN